MAFYFQHCQADFGVQILMLSGIGPAPQLAFHDVTPLVDLPGVGEHLMDHPAVHANFLEKSGYSLGWVRKVGGVNIKAISALFQWTWMGSGPLTTHVSDYAARYITRAHGPNVRCLHGVGRRRDSVHPRRCQSQTIPRSSGTFSRRRLDFGP